MAGSTTAERGERKRESSGPPPVRAVRRRRLRLIIASAVVLLFLGSGAFWLLYGSDLVRVERVSVSGTDVLTQDQVREAADVPLGEQLVSVDTGAIERRAAEKLPRIDTVDVVRSWPDEIKLRVTERTPSSWSTRATSSSKSTTTACGSPPSRKRPRACPRWKWTSPVPVPPRRVSGDSARTVWCVRRYAWRRRPRVPRAGNAQRQGPFLRRHLAGTHGRPYGRLGKQREGGAEGPGPRRADESGAGRTALRRQRSQRPGVIRELTHICAGQHPGWAVTRLIT